MFFCVNFIHSHIRNNAMDQSTLISHMAQTGSDKGPMA